MIYSSINRVQIRFMHYTCKALIQFVLELENDSNTSLVVGRGYMCSEDHFPSCHYTYIVRFFHSVKCPWCHQIMLKQQSAEWMLLLHIKCVGNAISQTDSQLKWPYTKGILRKKCTHYFDFGVFWMDKITRVFTALLHAWM